MVSVCVCVCVCIPNCEIFQEAVVLLELPFERFEGDRAAIALIRVVE